MAYRITRTFTRRTDPNVQGSSAESCLRFPVESSLPSRLQRLQVVSSKSFKGFVLRPGRVRGQPKLCDVMRESGCCYYR